MRGRTKQEDRDTGVGDGLDYEVEVQGVGDSAGSSRRSAKDGKQCWPIRERCKGLRWGWPIR